MFRIVGELLHPIAQLRHMHAQVLRSLHIGHASLLDQAHSLKLELAGKLPSLHDPPPAPSKHLTRCLRNRVQAMDTLYDKGYLGVMTRTGAAEQAYRGKQDVESLRAEQRALSAQLRQLSAASEQANSA